MHNFSRALHISSQYIPNTWFSSPSNMVYMCWIYPWHIYWGWFIFKIILFQKRQFSQQKNWKIKCGEMKYPRRMLAWLTKVIWWLYIFSTPVLCWFRHSALAIMFLFQENTYCVLYWTTDWSSIVQWPLKNRVRKEKLGNRMGQQGWVAHSNFNTWIQKLVKLKQMLVQMKGPYKG